MTTQQALALALEHLRAGRLGEADAIYNQVLAVQPNNAEAWHRRGMVAHQMGRYDHAVEWIRHAVALQPNGAAGHNNLGESYRAAGRLDEAISSYDRALQLAPNHPAILNNLGIALDGKGELARAVAIYRQVLQLKPDYAEAHSNLANALSAQGHYPEAIAEFWRAIECDPNLAIAHSNLGATLTERGELDAGLAALERAVQLDPTSGDGLNNMANVLKEQGRMDEAVAAFRRANQAAPHHAGIHSNLIHALHYQPGLERAVLLEEQARWNRQFYEPARPLIQPHNNDRDPDRRLRIGYVSGDFRDHVVGRNLRPLFAHHDRERFEIYCYSGVLVDDKWTSEFRRESAQWRSTVGIQDRALAGLIRRDGVDILVDLGQHTAGNKLPAFACRPAPVQVSFAGYPESTGVAALDYRISDPYLERMKDEGGRMKQDNAEQVLLLDSFWCYDPCGIDVETNKLPAAENGYITFGSLNNFCKINPVVLRLWARVLRGVKDSRLVLLSREGSHRERALGILQEEGVAPNQVEFVRNCPRPEYLRLYHQLDINLDPFPYNGHTTSLDALWMGVPLVTLAGEYPAGRGGLSQLSNLGEEALVASSEDDYVAIACDLAADLDRLATLRRTLRSRMQESVLMNGARFARSIEATYRAMWRRWCAAR